MSPVDQTKTVLLCGVGGQGTILAADLLAHTLMAAGFDVKLSEVHGMAQRGGAVTTVVRYGPKVHSMVADVGTADYIVAFELTEALRNKHFLTQEGVLFVNDLEVLPLTVLTGSAQMPKKVYERLDACNAIVLPADVLAEEAGSAKSANVVLLGALSTELGIPNELWEAQIEARVPEKTVSANIKAFYAGITYTQGATS